MDFDKWEKILSTVNGKSDVIQKIKDELLKEDQNTYQEWGKNGFNVDHKFKPSQVTLLHLAAKYGYKGIAELLIEKNAKLNEKEGFFGYTPLHFAAMYGSRNVAKLLIENGANVDEKNKHTGTALHLAAAFGRADIVKLLIENGANVDEKDRHGKTPLYIATCNERNDVEEILIIAGANTSIAESNKINKVVPLVKKGLDNLLKNESGKTTSGLAEDKEYIEILSLAEKMEEVKLSLIKNGCILRSVLDSAPESFKRIIIKKSKEDGYDASEEEVNKITIKGKKPVDVQEIIEYAFSQVIERGKLIMQMGKDISQNPKNTLSKTHPNRYGMALNAAQIEESMCLSSEKQPQLASTPKKSDACNDIAVDNKDQTLPPTPRSHMKEIKTEHKPVGKSQWYS